MLISLTLLPPVGGFADVAHALLRAVSRFVSTPARAHSNQGVETSVDTARKSACATSLLAIGCRAAGEQLAAVRQLHLFGVAHRLAGLGTIALDDNRRSRRD